MTLSMKTLLLTSAVATLSFHAIAGKELNGNSASAKPVDQLANKNRQALSFSQNLDPDLPVTLGQSGLEVSSKSYYQEFSGAELKRGVQFKTAGEAAVIRLTPMKSQRLGKTQIAPVIEPNDLILTGNSGDFNVNKSGMSIKARSDQLSDTHPGIFENTAAFVIDKTLGQGQFNLKTERNVADDDRYLLHVFDKHSSIAMQLATERPAFASGESLQVSAKLTAARFKSDNLTATLIAPDGRRFDMASKLSKTGVQLELPLNMDTERKAGELWKVVLHGETDTGILRTAELAVDIHQKTAAITDYRMSKGQLSITLQVEQPGRYELRSWWFQQQGKRSEPYALDYFANWFEAGQHRISIPVTQLNKSSLQLKQLQLLDQSRLAVLETL